MEPSPCPMLPLGPTGPSGNLEQGLGFHFMMLPVTHVQTTNNLAHMGIGVIYIPDIESLRYLSLTQLIMLS